MRPHEFGVCRLTRCLFILFFVTKDIFFIMHGYTHSLQYLHSYLDNLQKTSTYTHIICNISCSVWWIPSLTLYKGFHYLDYLQCGTYILTIQYDHLRYEQYKCLQDNYEAVFISILTCQLSSFFAQNFVQRTTTTLYEQRQLCKDNDDFVRIMFTLCTNNVNFARTTTTLHE